MFRKLWVRTWGFALLALAAAGASRGLSPFLTASLADFADVGAALNILAVLSSTMLAVTTFPLGVIMSTRLAITSTISPRAHQPVADDPVSQRLLATFMGAFVHALTGQVLLWAGGFEAGASAVLLVVSVPMLILVVVAMLSWIGTSPGSAAFLRRWRNWMRRWRMHSPRSRVRATGCSPMRRAMAAAVQATGASGP